MKTQVNELVRQNRILVCENASLKIKNKNLTAKNNFLLDHLDYFRKKVKTTESILELCIAVLEKDNNATNFKYSLS